MFPSVVCVIRVRQFFPDGVVCMYTEAYLTKGETLYKITKRVFLSFLESKSKYITWFDANEKKVIVKINIDMSHCIRILMILN